MLDLTISIVNYNTRELLGNLINSIYRNTEKISYEIIIVDNNSSDGSVAFLREKFPAIQFIANDKNVGFAAANNQAIRMAQGRYIVLLNSDVVLLPNTLDLMVEFMDNNSAAAVIGCRILNPDGSLQLSGKTFPSPAVAFYLGLGLHRLFPGSGAVRKYYLPIEEVDAASEVDQVTGSALLIRREVVEEVGLMDENYFLYIEDTDWCYRIKQKGYKIFYYPVAALIHHKGKSSQKLSSMMIREFYRSVWYFYQKFYAQKYPWFINLLWYLAVKAKIAVALLRNSLSREKMVRY